MEGKDTLIKAGPIIIGVIIGLIITFLIVVPIYRHDDGSIPICEVYLWRNE
ncbi:MAG: hypothetical protein AB2421_18340 [Thermotaleaceae bacterium]